MKNFREYYQECLEAETPKFVRVMKAVPVDQASYRPHPRSTCAGDLVWLLASELRDACELIDQGEVSYVARAVPTVTESIAAYERNAEDVATRVAALDDARWDSTGPVARGRKGCVGNLTRRYAFWISFRCDPSSRTAVELPATDGREGSVDLRSFG